MIKFLNYYMVSKIILRDIVTLRANQPREKQQHMAKSQPSFCWASEESEFPSSEKRVDEAPVTLI